MKKGVLSCFKSIQPLDMFDDRMTTHMSNIPLLQLNPNFCSAYVKSHPF